jgi:hypothetical protein
MFQRVAAFGGGAPMSSSGWFGVAERVSVSRFGESLTASATKRKNSMRTSDSTSSRERARDKQAATWISHQPSLSHDASLC